jgi:hypothetical protein
VGLERSIRGGKDGQELPQNGPGNGTAFLCGPLPLVGPRPDSQEENGEDFNNLALERLARRQRPRAGQQDAAMAATSF